jgi:hypothetical protein
MRKSLTKQILTTDIRQMSMSMISSMGNFLPKKKAAGGGAGGQIVNWVAVGGGNSLASKIARSPDGNTWTASASKGGINLSGINVAYGKNGTGTNAVGRWVAVGDGSLIAHSPDGIIWTPAATVSGVSGKGGITSFGRGVAYGKDELGNGRWVAVGNGVISSIAHSPDGNTWTAAVVDAIKGGITNGFGVAYGKDNSGNGRWVVVGEGSLIAHSPDGNNWTEAATKGGITTIALGVAYGKDGAGAGLWVAVGYGGIIAKSSDGNVWTPAATVSGVSGKGGITDAGSGVAYGKDNLGAGLWVAVGYGGIIAKSTDGNTWTEAATKGSLTSGSGVAYGKDNLGNGRWVAVGEGSFIAHSPDGNTWTQAGNVGGISTGDGVAFKKNINEPFFINTPGMTASSNYRGVSMSANGQYILICRSGSPSGVFRSTNFGASFILISTLGTTNNWTCCSMTPNGQTMAVAGDPTGIVVSNNYGANWTTRTPNDKYISLRISYNTLNAVAISYNLTTPGVYQHFINDISASSIDSTTLLFAGTNPILFPQSTCISKSAKYVVVLCYGLQSGIAISTNSGSSFSYYECVTGSSNADSNYYAAAINNDETKIFVVVSTGPLMGIWTFNVSNDTISAAEKNTTFSAIIPTPNNLRDLAISKDNLTIVVTSNTRTYYSFDGGIVWTDVYLGHLQCIAMSDNGNNIMATSTNNLIPQISRT